MPSSRSLLCLLPPIAAVACSGSAPPADAPSATPAPSPTAVIGAVPTGDPKPVAEDDPLLQADLHSADPQVRELAKGCHDDDGMACEKLGTTFLKKDELRALHYYERSCGLGQTAGCYGWGYILSSNPKGTPQQYARAHELLLRSCDEDHRRACGLLGLQYYWGERGQPKDRPRAARYYRKACDAGEVEVSCLNLGMMMLGKEIPGDDAKAVALFKRSCDAGNAQACFNIAMVALDGVKGWSRQDALRLLDRSCKKRHEDSCIQLQKAKRDADAKRPTGAPGKRSKIPTLKEWDAVSEVAVTGSSALRCESKMVREWLRVSCRGSNDSGGTPTTVRVVRGGRSDTYTYAAHGVTSLVTPFVAGVHLEAEYSWTDKQRKLTVDWRPGTPKPPVVGVFEGS